MKRSRLFFAFVVLALLLAQWSNNTALAKKDRGNPQFDPAFVAQKMNAVSASLAPKSKAEKIQYNALLSLKSRVMAQQEPQFQEKQAQKDILFQMIAPSYKEYADKLEQGTASMAASGNYPLKDLMNRFSGDLDTMIGISRPTEISMANIDTKVDPRLKGVIRPALSVGTAIKGDPIMVHSGKWWVPTMYGYWSHTIVTLGYNSYIHAPQPGKKNAITTWQQDIKGKIAAIMGVWVTSTIRNNAGSFSKAQEGEWYNILSPKWYNGSWYCSKLSWAGYYYSYWGLIDLDSNGGYWVTPDNIYWSPWTFLRAFSWSA